VSDLQMKISIAVQQTLLRKRRTLLQSMKLMRKTRWTRKTRSFFENLIRVTMISQLLINEYCNRILAIEYWECNTTLQTALIFHCYFRFKKHYCMLLFVSSFMNYGFGLILNQLISSQLNLTISLY